MGRIRFRLIDCAGAVVIRTNGQEPRTSGRSQRTDRPRDDEFSAVDGRELIRVRQARQAVYAMDAKFIFKTVFLLKSLRGRVECIQP